MVVLLVVAVVVLSNNGFFTGRATRYNNPLEVRMKQSDIGGGIVSQQPTQEDKSGTQYVTDGCECDLSGLNQVHFLFKKEDHCTIQSNACEGYCKIWAAVPDKYGYVTSKSHIYTKNVPCKNTASIASSGLNY